MKVIDLEKTCVFTNDIVNVYEKRLSYECGYDYKWYLQTKTNCIEISYDDYCKVKNYMISLNKNTSNENKKIDKLYCSNSDYYNQCDLIEQLEQELEKLRGEDNGLN